MTFTATVHYTVTCDTVGCESAILTPSFKEKWDAHRNAKACGWRVDQERHWCPACVLRWGGRR